MKLTAENVKKVFFDCFYTDAEVSRFPEGSHPPDCIIVRGVRGSFGFHPGRLASHKQDIRSMLEELPDDFMDYAGGGMTFLNACMTKTGEQWGEHEHIDMLICLGIGLGIVAFNIPRETWSAFPGGMPYFYVLSEGNMETSKTNLREGERV